MRRKIGVVFALAAALMLLLCFAACGSDKKEALTLEVSVPQTVAVGDEVTPEIRTLDEASVSVQVTAPDASQITLEKGASFKAEAKGEYSVYVKAVRGQDVREKTVTVIAYDLTGPVISAPPSDKTIGKGEYDFTADLQSVAAADDTSSADMLTKWVKQISYDGKAVDFDEKQTTYLFEQAGVYTVTFVVSDADENKTEGTYSITVEGVNASLAKTDYEIGETIALPEVTVYPQGGTVSFAYVKEGETFAVDKDFALYEAGEYSLKITLKSGEEELDSIELAFKVSDIALEIEGDISGFYTSGAEFTVPEFTVDNEKASVSAALVSGDGETAVTAGEKILLKSGSYTLKFTVTVGDAYEKVYNYAFYCRQPGEMVSFEKDGSTYDGANGAENVGPFEINTDSAYVKYGAQSAKLLVNDGARAGFTWFQNGRKYSEVENANAVRFWIYVDNNGLQWDEARVKFTVETGVTVNVDYFKYTTDLIVLKAGQWNEVVIELYGSDCDLSDGLCALYFQQWDPENDWTWASTMNFYLDGIAADYIVPANSISLEKTDYVVSSTGFAVPEAKVRYGEPSVILTDLETEETQPVTVGQELTLTEGNRYTLTYTAEKLEGNGQDVTAVANLYVRQSGEMVSFEKDGATYDGGNVTPVGTLTVNTVPAYVKYGVQSAKLLVNEGARAGFTWYAGARKYSEVENANALRFWVYVEETDEKEFGEARVKFTVETGVSEEDNYFKYTTDLIVLKAGQWNEVVIELYGSGCDLSDGLCALYFQQWDPAGDWSWASTMNFYVDGIFAAYLAPVNAITLEKTDIVTAADGFTVPAAQARYGEVTAVLTKSGESEGTPVTIGQKIDLEAGGEYTLTYTAEKLEGNEQAVTATAYVYVKRAGEMVSFEKDGTTHDGLPFDVVNGGTSAVCAISDEQAAGGKYSLKLDFDGTNKQNGFVDYGLSKKGTSGATTLQFELYVSDMSQIQLLELKGKAGSGDDYNNYTLTSNITSQIKQNGWNTITVSTDLPLDKGLCEFYFRMFDSNWANQITPVVTLYVDCITVY